MAWTKYKHGFQKYDLFKKMLIKYPCPIIASKRPVIIETLFLSVFCHIPIIPQKKHFNSSMSKHKTKIMPIIYITKPINTSKHNVR